MNEEEILHRELVSKVLKFGESYAKKHGNWVRLKLSDNGLWLVMDSWNKAIKVVKGLCEYDNIYTGFDAKTYKELRYIGGNFGGFNYGSPSEVIEYYISLVNAEES